jgi:hypothetical protein
MVVDDYYKEGQAINQDLRRARMASLLGKGVLLRYDASGGQMIGLVSGRDAAQTDTLSVHLIHPTQPDKDRTLIVTPDNNGRFSAALPIMEKTQWQIVVEDGKSQWRLDGIWSWPQQSEIRIQADPLG